jgi:hypothetical protein
MLTARMVVDLGIWLSPSVYRRLPIPLPYAVRDPSCRGDKSKGLPDEWGSPNAEGLFRDDNSLVKGLPRSLPIRSPLRELYDGRRMGTGFVAAHVWRELRGTGLASRDPLTYSFVPNVVWLPSDVAKLTDREGSFAQTYLQALSMKIYREDRVGKGLESIVEQAWTKLPHPLGIPKEGLPEIADLNFFEPTEGFLQRRISKITEVVRAVDAVLAGRRLEGRVIASRYTSGLPSVPHKTLDQLKSHLESYLSGMEEPVEGGA